MSDPIKVDKIQAYLHSTPEEPSVILSRVLMVMACAEKWRSYFDNNTQYKKYLENSNLNQTLTTFYEQQNALAKISSSFQKPSYEPPKLTRLG